MSLGALNNKTNLRKRLVLVLTNTFQTLNCPSSDTRYRSVPAIANTTVQTTGIKIGEIRVNWSVSLKRVDNTLGTRRSFSINRYQIMLTF